MTGGFCSTGRVVSKPHTLAGGSSPGRLCAVFRRSPQHRWRSSLPLRRVRSSAQARRRPPCRMPVQTRLLPTVSLWDSSSRHGCHPVVLRGGGGGRGGRERGVWKAHASRLIKEFSINCVPDQAHKIVWLTAAATSACNSANDDSGHSPSHGIESLASSAPQRSITSISFHGATLETTLSATQPEQETQACILENLYCNHRETDPRATRSHPLHTARHHHRVEHRKGLGTFVTQVSH